MELANNGQFAAGMKAVEEGPPQAPDSVCLLAERDEIKSVQEASRAGPAGVTNGAEAASGTPLDALLQKLRNACECPLLPRGLTALGVLFATGFECSSGFVCNKVQML
jgi:hypothetical protein